MSKIFIKLLLYLIGILTMCLITMFVMWDYQYFLHIGDVVPAERINLIIWVILVPIVYGEVAYTYIDDNK